MTRWMACILAVVLCGTVFGAVGQTPPQLVQPDQAGYTASQRTVLDRAIVELKRVLSDPDLASKRGLGQNGWTLLDFAAFTAGSLERLGYQTAIVRLDRGTTGERVWVLAGFEVLGTVVWVPVEPLSNPTRRQAVLGTVAEANSTRLMFDPQYLTYDEVVELPPNVPPVAIIRPPGRVLEQQSTALFGHTSSDPDGEIVLYTWSFPETEPQTTIASSIWHTFPAVGTYVVELTVTDSRGAQASTTLTIEAVEENDCGCPAHRP